MVSKFEDLIVYQRAYSSALEIHKITQTFPKSDLFTLGNQMQRASKGICANIAEGFAKNHKSSKEFKRFLLMALGSSEEMRVWISFCKDLNHIDNITYEKLHNEYTEISKMLYGLDKNWKTT